MHNTLKTAFTDSLPIMAGFIVLGTAYGIYMRSLGFEAFYPVLMATIIFAGSVEFIAAGFLLASFNPIYCFLITLMVSARQIFYSIAMLEKFHQAGRKKYYLISATVDESFAVIYNSDVDKSKVDYGWYMVFVTLMLQAYWITGAATGALLADYLPFSLKGSEFAMVALFLVIFLEAWLKEPTHESSLIGLGVTAVCLIIFGAKIFLIPAMLMILLLLTLRQSVIKIKFQQAMQVQPTLIAREPT